MGVDGRDDWTGDGGIGRSGGVEDSPNRDLGITAMIIICRYQSR